MLFYVPLWTLIEIIIQRYHFSFKLLIFFFQSDPGSVREWTNRIQKQSNFWFSLIFFNLYLSNLLSPSLVYLNILLIWNLWFFKALSFGNCVYEFFDSFCPRIILFPIFQRVKSSEVFQNHSFSLNEWSP